MRVEKNNGKLFVQWDDNSKKELHSLSYQSPNFGIWVVIPNFRLFICGDLAYFLTIQGRDGASGSRCPYCQINLAHNRKNKNSENHHNCPLLSLEQMVSLGQSAAGDPSKKGDYKGFKNPPHFDVEPGNFIVPLLHLEIGLVNYAWQSFRETLNWSHMKKEK